MKVVTVTFNPAVDKTLLVPDFRFERVVRVQQVFVYPSGKGVNVARVLTRLGMSVICLGFVGGYAGAFLRDGLTREGIPHDFTTVSEETRTNITLRDPVRGMESHLVEAGARVTPTELSDFLQTFQSHLRDATWIAFCGSLPPGISPDFYAQLIHLAHRHSVSCALDTSGAALREGLAAVPELVNPIGRSWQKWWVKRWTATNEFALPSENFCQGVSFALSSRWAKTAPSAATARASGKRRHHRSRLSTPSVQAMRC